MRTLPRYICIVALLSLSGCSLLSLSSKSAPPAPALPRASYETVEAIREAADFTERGLAVIWSRGAPPEAPLSEQAKLTAAAVSDWVGKPPVPLVVPGSVTERYGEVDSLLTSIAKNIEKDQARKYEWELDYEAFRRTPVETGMKFLQGKTGWLVGIIASLLGLMAVGVPVGGILIWLLRGWKKTVRDVVVGVQDFKDNSMVSGEVIEELKDSLRASTDVATKIAVDKQLRTMGK